jgi:hypothetical protein
LRRPPRNGGQGGHGVARGRAGIRGPFAYREKPYKRLEIIFVEGIRAVTHQQGLLDSVRTRATTLTARDSSSTTGRPATDDAPAAALLAVDTPTAKRPTGICPRRMHALRHERLSVVVRLAADE